MQIRRRHSSFKTLACLPSVSGQQQARDRGKHQINQNKNAPYPIRSRSSFFFFLHQLYYISHVSCQYQPKLENHPVLCHPRQDWWPRKLPSCHQGHGYFSHPYRVVSVIQTRCYTLVFTASSAAVPAVPRNGIMISLLTLMPRMPAK